MQGITGLLEADLLAGRTGSGSPLPLYLAVLMPILFGLATIVRHFVYGKTQVGGGHKSGPGVDMSSLAGGPGAYAPGPVASGISCPRCGAMAGGGAATCSGCGSRLPEPEEPLARAPALRPGPDAGGGYAASCPFCGTMLAAGVRVCPGCNWRLHEAAGAPPEGSVRIGVVRHDIIVGGNLAFKKDEWVRIEGERPDPVRPEFRYIALSRPLGRRFLLSDGDLAT